MRSSLETNPHDNDNVDGKGYYYYYYYYIVYGVMAGGCAVYRLTIITRNAK